MLRIVAVGALVVLLAAGAACSSSSKPPPADQTVSPEEAARAVTVTVGTPLVRQVPLQILPRATAVPATASAAGSGLSAYQSALFDCAGKLQALIASESSLSGGPVLDAERTLRTDPGNGAAIAQIGRAVQPMHEYDQEIEATSCDSSVSNYLQLAKTFSADELQALVLLNEAIASPATGGSQTLQQSTQLTLNAVDAEQQITVILQNAIPATPHP